MKSYTDLEQSKRLAEILPIESADECWTNHLFNDFLSSWRIESTSPLQYKILLDRFVVKGYLIEPAWSLAALIEVLPNTITSNDGIAFGLNIRKNIIEYSNPSLYLVYKSVKADNLIDACYEMILKLNELNLL